MKRSPRSIWTVRALALITVMLALMCLALTLAWKRERARADCWRATVEDDQAQPEGDCRQI